MLDICGRFAGGRDVGCLSVCLSCGRATDLVTRRCECASFYRFPSVTPSFCRWSRVASPALSETARPAAIGWRGGRAVVDLTVMVQCVCRPATHALPSPALSVVVCGPLWLVYGRSVSRSSGVYRDVRRL